MRRAPDRLPDWPRDACKPEMDLCAKPDFVQRLVPLIVK